jgi:ParB family chromosome partitioning protein
VLAGQYGLSRNTVARFLRVQQLILSLKTRLDAGEIAFISAVTLSFLKERDQRALDKCMKTNGFNVDMRKADVLRAYSDKGTLDEGKIYLILNGELGQPPKKNRTPTVKVSKTLYARFFKPDQSAREIQDYVEKALCFYFEYQAQKNALRTKPRKSEPDPGYDEPHDIDENEDDEDDWLEQ